MVLSKQVSGFTYARFIAVRFMAALLFLFLMVPYAIAQDPDGALAGTIRDSSGARISGAQVSLTSAALGVSRSTTSNNLGEFRLEALLPGDYQLQVAATRFATSHSAVRITVGSVSTVSIVLKPEVAAQSVQVEARGESVTSQTIDTTSSVEQSVITAKDLVSLPLASRSFANIAYLSPTTHAVEPSAPTKRPITPVSVRVTSRLT